ncbi:MAG: CRISPR-associated endoribonuclease Cas6 [candidate division WOR-3 bacterium]
MRLLIKFTSGHKTPINHELRKPFISFLKKVFEKSDENYFNELFNSKKAKPYCFSPYFGKDFAEKYIGKNISLIFSTGNPDILIHFWNGILALKEDNSDYLSINGIKFYLRNLTLLPPKKINSTKAIFRTIGISVLTNPQQSAKDFENWYITPEQDNLDEFNEVLRKRTQERFLHIKGVNKEINLTFSLLQKPEKLVEKTIVPHYGGYIKGFRGTFLLEGDPEILQFLYDFGLGVRTGQGFGLLKLVKEI